MFIISIFIIIPICFLSSSCLHLCKDFAENYSQFICLSLITDAKQFLPWFVWAGRLALGGVTE